MAKSTH